MKLLWDIKAPLYGHVRKIFPLNFIHSKELINIRALLSRLNLNGSNILDVGSGTGIILDFLPSSSTIIAVDVSIKMLSRTKNSGSNLLVADAHSLPLKSRSVKLVTAIGLLEYSDKQSALLKELQRVAVSKSYFLVSYSQKSVLNYLRHMLGHRLYLLSTMEFDRLIRAAGLMRAEVKRSLLQRQVLLQNV